MKKEKEEKIKVNLEKKEIKILVEKEEEEKKINLEEEEEEEETKMMLMEENLMKTAEEVIQKILKQVVGKFQEVNLEEPYLEVTRDNKETQSTGERRKEIAAVSVTVLSSFGELEGGAGPSNDKECEDK
nr:PREDICTED: putative uncharacterized protein DDB_G0287113 [Latimeria chalumnae]|eukprot:XP_014354105.1 PREDICTED: putative uncharacterized protein DDB_G0287113 [Latimeria chalumnae]